MNLLQQRAREAITQHGGLRKASRALNINNSVLCMLAEGRRTSASPKTLRALGLRKKHEYEPIPVGQR